MMMMMEMMMMMVMVMVMMMIWWWYDMMMTQKTWFFCFLLIARKSSSDWGCTASSCCRIHMLHERTQANVQSSCWGASFELDGAISNLWSSPTVVFEYDDGTRDRSPGNQDGLNLLWAKIWCWDVPHASMDQDRAMDLGRIWGSLD